MVELDQLLDTSEEVALVQVRKFLAERCVRGAEERTGTGDLYRAYTRWWENRPFIGPLPEPYLNQARFGQAVRSLGHERRPASGSNARYLGLRLR